MWEAKIEPSETDIHLRPDAAEGIRQISLPHPDLGLVIGRMYAYTPSKLFMTFPFLFLQLYGQKQIIFSRKEGTTNHLCLNNSEDNKEIEYPIKFSQERMIRNVRGGIWGDGRSAEVSNHS